MLCHQRTRRPTLCPGRLWTHLLKDASKCLAIAADHRFNREPHTAHLGIALEGTEQSNTAAAGPYKRRESERHAHIIPEPRVVTEDRRAHRLGPIRGGWVGVGAGDGGKRKRATDRGRHQPPCDVLCRCFKTFSCLLVRPNWLSSIIARDQNHCRPDWYPSDAAASCILCDPRVQQNRGTALADWQ